MTQFSSNTLTPLLNLHPICAIGFRSFDLISPFSNILVSFSIPSGVFSNFTNSGSQSDLTLLGIGLGISLYLQYRIPGISFPFFNLTSFTSLLRLLFHLVSMSSVTPTTELLVLDNGLLRSDPPLANTWALVFSLNFVANNFAADILRIKLILATAILRLPASAHQ